MAGPEPRAWIGASATAAASSTPPPEVTISTRPPKPASRRRPSSPRRYSLITGFNEASMHVDDARLYSRMDGLSRCESVYGTPGRCSSSRSPTRASWTGFAIDQSRQTPTASTSRASRHAQSSTTACSSSGFTTSPAAPSRSGTWKVSARGTYGSGHGRVKLNGSVRPPSRKSSTSGWPSVVRNAVRAIVPVRTALIARVVAWRKTEPRASRSSPSAPAAAASTSSPPCTGSSGVVALLNRCSVPSSPSTTRSVNVPPVSTASLTAPRRSRVEDFRVLREAESSPPDVHLEHAGGIVAVASLERVEEQPVLDEGQVDDLRVKAEVGAPVRLGDVPEDLDDRE